MRLITRSDFDGLVCAVLLVEAGIVASDIKELDKYLKRYRFKDASKILESINSKIG
jgi:hypothetical protein